MSCGTMAPTMRPQNHLAAVLLWLPVAALGQAPAPAKPAMPPSHPPMSAGAHAKVPPSPWAEMGDYTITVKVPPKGETGTWKFRTFEDPADVVIELDTPAPKGRTRGTMMLVAGQAIAIKGFTPEPGFEIDPLDAAVVNLKMLTRLLEAALPAGPSALKGKQPVKARDDKTPIMASTPTSTAQFNAPWALAGTVERVDAATIAFQLEVEMPGGEKPADRVRWSFAGNAGGTPKGRVLDSATSLAGWTVYSLGPAKSAKQSHATLRFGATRLDGPFATVKDLRAFLAQPVAK